jgi:hypothetical protein
VPFVVCGSGGQQLLPIVQGRRRHQPQRPRFRSNVSYPDQVTRERENILLVPPALAAGAIMVGVAMLILSVPDHAADSAARPTSGAAREK